MEQFKKLNWSWYKYKDERTQPKSYNFETIDDHDILSRTLNEVHKCVLPQRDEYRLMKPQEELSSENDDDEEIIEVKDPRENPTSILEKPEELSRIFGYSSELNVQEQRHIMNSLKLKIKHNPALYINESPRKQRQLMKLSLDLEKKRKVELIHFKKCAETFYYRHVSELNSILGIDIRTFLVNRWRNQESVNELDCSFKAITMLLRGHKCEGDVSVELKSKEEDDTFDHESYLISNETFLLLNKFTPLSLKEYNDLKKSPAKIETDLQYEFAISLDVLSKLLSDTDQFGVAFENSTNKAGNIVSTFGEPLPSKPVSLVKAIEEYIRLAVNLGHEWNCLENYLKANVKEITDASSASPDYRVESTSTVMIKNFNRFKKFTRENQTLALWSMSKDTQSFQTLVVQNDIFFVRSKDDTLTQANISIKLEFQLKFGAERMEKGELLSEWCHQKFNENSITLRYRVDAKSFVILSITQVSLEEIEEDLLNNHQTNPNLILGSVINVFSCIKRLPEGKYKIKTTIDDDVKKLFINKACERTEEISDVPWTISSEFVRSWIPIDDSTTTFVHLNHQLAPCCFVSSNKRKHTSYLQPIKGKKKPAAKPTVLPYQNLKKKNKKKKNKKGKLN